MTTQLSFERIALVPSAPMRRNVEQTIQWAKETNYDGKAVIKLPWVRRKFAEFMMELEVLKMLNYYVVWLITKDAPVYAESSMVKVYGVELNQRLNSSLLQIMGQFGQLQTGSKWTPLKGKVEHALRMDIVLIFGGGALEVQRNIMAMAGLGMPRSI